MSAQPILVPEGTEVVAPPPRVEMPNQSPTIDQLAAALSKAQGDIKNAKRDADNPFFKSSYATLAACWEAARAQLAKWELSVIQTTHYVEDRLMLRTTLAHSSGQWIAGELPILAKDDGPQAMGSALTYARRYGFTAIVGVAPDADDDDGESAQARGKTAPASGPVPPCPKCGNIGRTSQYAKKGEEFFCGKCRKPYGAHNAMMAAEPGDEPPF